MVNPLKRLMNFITTGLWRIDRAKLGPVRRFFVDIARFVVVIVRDLLYGQVTLWAMGLVYTSLMSLVPLLAVSFSVLKAFGVQNKLEPFLLNLVAPLGANGPVIVHRIVEFVNNMRVGVLGLVGLGLLVYTVMSLIQKVEQAFNTVWRVRGGRSMLHQFSEYLSVILVGPVLVVSALALTASLMSTALVRRLMQIQPFGALVAAAGTLIPYVLVCASFIFLYLFLPNTRVRWSAAIVGGVIGGVLWESVGWGFASFIVASTKYAAIYSSFAILILFMTWLYLSWLILLIGCEVSFFYQNPQLLSLRGAAGLPNARLIEQAVLSIMFLIAEHFYRSLPPWTVNDLVERLGLSVERVEDLLSLLKAKGLIVETGAEQVAYVPARDLNTILVEDVYNAVRERSPGELSTGRLPQFEPVDRIMEEIDAAIGNAVKKSTWEELVRSAPAPETETADRAA